MRPLISSCSLTTGIIFLLVCTIVFVLLKFNGEQKSTQYFLPLPATEDATLLRSSITAEDESSGKKHETAINPGVNSPVRRKNQGANQQNDVAQVVRGSKNSFKLPGPAKATKRPQLRRQRLPDAVIIGVKKGGTRAMIEMLSSHPDVVVAHAEMHFFSNSINYDKGLKWYIRQMPFADENSVVMEKSPS